MSCITSASNAGKVNLPYFRGFGLVWSVLGIAYKVDGVSRLQRWIITPAGVPTMDLTRTTCALDTRPESSSGSQT